MIPKLPFPGYKWRWLSVQPSEGLLKASVFLGVLRALSHFEGESFGSPNLSQELATVEHETQSTVRLARTGVRNLFRNSGQYWRGTGLLRPDPGEIQLTNLGRRTASGKITQSEFTAIMIDQVILPNPWTYSQEAQQAWRDADLEIRPLQMILDIIEELSQSYGVEESFLSNTELARVVVPLAGEKRAVSDIASYVHRFRSGQLSISSWPDCVPQDNDIRLTNEFLLFLSNFGVLRRELAGKRDDHKYRMDDFFKVDALDDGGATIFEDEQSAERAIKVVVESDLPAFIDKQRRRTEVWTRPRQAQFRSQILQAFEGRCLFTDEEIPEVLEAAHIVPVSEQGSDEVSNGLCLRVDIHRLYDSGHVRIDPEGMVELSDSATESVNYRSLPYQVELPAFLDFANVHWRYKYQ